MLSTIAFYFILADIFNFILLLSIIIVLLGIIMLLLSIISGPGLQRSKVCLIKCCFRAELKEGVIIMLLLSLRISGPGLKIQWFLIRH